MWLLNLLHISIRDTVSCIWKGMSGPFWERKTPTANENCSAFTKLCRRNRICSNSGGEGKAQASDPQLVSRRVPGEKVSRRRVGYHLTTQTDHCCHSFCRVALLYSQNMQSINCSWTRFMGKRRRKTWKRMVKKELKIQFESLTDAEEIIQVEWRKLLSVFSTTILKWTRGYRISWNKYIFNNSWSV